ncbi:MAG TPA: extracellular solute-binding protein [Clostridiales bacterium]|nr:extracellular solute-binding protein [Clostridiales bacterium]
MKRKISLIIVCVLVFTFILSACTVAGTKSGTTSSDTDTTLQDTKPAEKIKITTAQFLEQSTEDYSINENPYVDFVEEKFNIDLTIIRTSSGQYGEKLNALLAAGDIPDLFISNKTFIAKYAEDGIAMNIDSLKPLAVNLNKNVNEEAWQAAMYNGKLYAIPNQRYDPFPYLSFVNKNFVETLNIDVNNIKTIDDYYDMFVKFRDNFENSIPVTAFINWPLMPLIDAFDAFSYKVIDGELLPNYLQPQYKEWLKFMQKMYKEKLIDQEFITQQSEQTWSKINSGKVGFYSWFWHQDVMVNQGGSRDDWLPIKPALKADGIESKLIYHSPARQFFFIGSKSKNPEKVIEMLDWAASEEGQLFIQAGLEGWDYDVKNGEIVMREGRKGQNMSWRFVTIGMDPPKLTSEKVLGVFAEIYGESGVRNYQAAYEFGGYDPILLNIPSFPDLDKYDFNKMRTEFDFNAIIGNIGIDAQWDSHITTFRKNGGDLLIDSLTKWYNNDYKK